MVEEHGYQQDNAERRQDGPQRAYHAAPYPLQFITHENGDIHRENARQRLRHREKVKELLLAEPAAVHHLPLDEGNHGIAPADGKHADFDECEE